LLLLQRQEAHQVGVRAETQQVGQVLIVLSVLSRLALP
jgi:hypothetical protein